MSSNEEYLEKMLQAVLNGEALTGEESMQEIPEENSSGGEITDDMLLDELEQTISGEAVSEHSDMGLEGLEQDLLSGLENMVVGESEPISDLENMVVEDSEPISGIEDMVIGEFDTAQASDIEDVSQSELGLDGMILDESSISDMEIEKSDITDMGLEELEKDILSGLENIAVGESESMSGLDDMTVGESEPEQESGIEDEIQDELGLDGMMLEETDSNGIEIEESDLADIGLEGLEQELLSGLEDVAVGESDPEHASDLADMVQDELGLDGMILEDSGISDMEIEESDLAEIGLEGLEPELLSGLESMTVGESGSERASDSEDMVQDELDLDSLMLDEPDINDVPQDDIGINDIALEESEPEGFDGIALEETEPEGFEGMALEESEPGRFDGIALEETEPEGFEGMALEESEPEGFDGIALEETEPGGFDGIALEETEPEGFEGMALEESEPEEFDGIALEETEPEGFEGMALEESEPEEFNGMALEESESEEFDGIALEETEPEGFEGMALEETEPEEFDGMALEESDLDEIPTDFEAEKNEMNEELLEINDMLGQPEQDEDIDDEMLALLESVSDSAGDDIEETNSNEFDFLGSDGEDGNSDNLTDLMAELEEPQESHEEEADDKKKKKWKKRRGKKAKADGEGIDGGDLAESEADVDAEKKPGFLMKLLAFLTETDEDEEGDDTTVGELSDENQELLNELSKEDKKAKKEKKGKKEKKAKKNKNDDGEGGEDAEDGGKTAKKKKPKKEKKVKEVDEEAVNAPPDKKLSKKKIIPVILFCVTITAAILIMSSVVPDYLQKQNAHVAFDMGNYEESYELLYGKNLNEEDEEILHKSKLIMMMERKLKSYQNYQRMGDNEIMALDALMHGVVLYYEILPEAEQYNVTYEIRSVYQEILDILSARYGLSEAYVIEIATTEDNVMYTEYLTTIIYGISFNDDIDGTESSESESPEAIEDILPEEQEIIDGL